MKMRTRAERRKSEIKEFNKRVEICKAAHCYDSSDEEYIKHKRDIPHSLGSNYWNAYETKSMKNKKDRLNNKIGLKKEMENFE